MAKLIRTSDATYRITAISMNNISPGPGAVCIYYLRDDEQHHSQQRRADASTTEVRGEDDAWAFVAAKLGGVVEDVIEPTPENEVP